MASDAYAISESRVLVFWSRKAGCTSLAAWLGAVLEGRWCEGMSRKQLEARRPDIWVDLRTAIDLIHGQGYEDFVLARDPIRRAISAWVEKFVYDRGRALDRVDLLKPFAWKFYVQCTALPAEQARTGTYRGLSFAGFLEHVAKVAREQRGLDEALNGHWRPQVPRLLEGHEFRNVVRLERPADFAPLSRRLGTELPFPRLRANSVVGRFVNDTDLSQASSLELIRDGVFPGPRALLTDHTLGLLREAYAADFRVLGYDPDASAAELR